MDRGAWCSIAHGAAKHQTWLKWHSMHATHYKTVGWTVLESASPLVKYVWKALLSGRSLCTQEYLLKLTGSAYDGCDSAKRQIIKQKFSLATLIHLIYFSEKQTKKTESKYNKMLTVANLAQKRIISALFFWHYCLHFLFLKINF